MKKTYTQSIANYGDFHHNTCPKCNSPNLLTGAGLKPGQISLRCGECKAFVGYRSIEKLRKLRQQKEQQAIPVLDASCGCGNKFEEGGEE